MRETYNSTKAPIEIFDNASPFAQIVSEANLSDFVKKEFKSSLV